MIDKYAFGASAGQTCGKLMDEDLEKHANGENRELAIKLIKENLMIQILALQEIKDDPVLGPHIDARLKL